jgi:hypothetical protein
VLEAKADVAELRDTIRRAASAVDDDKGEPRLDVAALQILETRFEEIGTQMIEKIDATLMARMQRFEALNQAMITLVGDPVDTLTAKLQQLASERESVIDAVESLRAMTETQQRILRGVGQASGEDHPES